MAIHNVMRLAGQTVSAPEVAAAQVYSYKLAPQGVWYGLLAISALNGIYTVLAPDASQLLGPLTQFPMLIAVGHAVLTAFFAYVSLVVGQVFRAERLDFYRVLQGLVWLKLVNFAVQICLTGLTLILPQTLIGFVAIGVLLYSLFILSVFYERCFEFESVWMGFATYLVASLSVAMLIVVILAMIGG